MKRSLAKARSAPNQSSAKSCRVWIVEDELAARKLVCAVVGTLPGFTVVGKSDRADPALDAAGAGRVDLVILDLMLPDDGGMSALRKFRCLPEAPRILIYSATVTAHSVQMAVSLGALGYVEKTEPLPEFRAALERVRDGGMHLSPQAGRMLSSLVQAKAAVEEKPSTLESRLLELLAGGASLKAAAYELQISYGKAHRLRQTLMARAQVGHSADLAGYAAAIGLAGLPRTGRGE
jgi:two-component system NarL family response regulator